HPGHPDPILRRRQQCLRKQRKKLSVSPNSLPSPAKKTSSSQLFIASWRRHIKRKDVSATSSTRTSTTPESSHSSRTLPARKFLTFIAIFLTSNPTLRNRLSGWSLSRPLFIERYCRRKLSAVSLDFCR